ncbi:MAG: glycoside hydrolase family 38 C-terminal domain-containing protein, partial [Acidimicrobiales bacterium]
GFGASIGWNPDAFGHAASLPQILVKAGIQAYVMMRPDEKEKSISSPLFEWVGSDGTAITTYRIPFSYSTDALGEEEMLRDRTSKLLENSNELGIPLMCFFGVGNHGGGPTRAALRTIREICATTDGRVSLGGPSTYFAHIGNAPRPEVRGDLQWHSVGCYSARAATKRANCQSEQELVVAEKMETLCRIMTGRRLDVAEQLGRGWRSLLLSQFHDSLGGTCTNFSTEGVDLLVSEARAVADRVNTLAVHALAQSIDTWTAGAESAEGLEASAFGGLPIPLVVCNPLSWATTVTVTIPYPMGACTDTTGTFLEVQHVTSGEATYSRSRTLLQLPLPPFGYGRFWLHIAGRDGGPRVDDRLAVCAEEHGSLCTIENDCLELAIDKTSGVVLRLLDKRTTRQWIGSEGVRAVVIDDTSDTWSHGIERYDAEERPWHCEGVEITERGPLRATVRSRFVFGSSTLTQEISLYRERPFAEINVDLEWHERYRLLKLAIPLAIVDPACAAGAPYGFAERSVTGHEEPMVHWVDVSERSGGGVTCTSNGTYAYDVLGGMLRLTLVRSPRVADHGRGWGADDPIGYPFLDQGAHSFSIRVHPHGGTWHDGAVKHAEEHLLTPPVVIDTWHPGPLAPSGSGLEVAEGSVIVAAAKRAESAPGSVFRILEVSGRPTNVVLTFRGRLEPWESQLSPHELCSVFVPDDTTEPVRIVDLCELEIHEDETP